MKRIKIIRITFIVYIIAMIGMFFGVDPYIKAKDERLYNEIQNKIDAVFENQKQYADIEFKRERVGYKEINILPASFKKDWDEYCHKTIYGDTIGFSEAYKEILDRWTIRYGDISKMYLLNFLEVYKTALYGHDEGWRLRILERNTLGYVCEYTVFPYAVGLKNDLEDIYPYNVEEIVNKAFNYCISNERSQYYNTFEKGCVTSAWSTIYDAQNEYYCLKQDSIPSYSISSSLPLEYFSLEDPSIYRVKAFEEMVLEDHISKVFIARTQPKTWHVKKIEKDIEKRNKEKLWLYWSIGLTILLLLIVVPLWNIEKKRKKIKEESLYDKLLRMCNPANFMKGNSYDKQKVDKANDIYKKLMQTNPEDGDTLAQLRQLAETDLEINFIDAEKLAELKEKVNPKKHMSPYDPDKVTLANELYNILSKEDLTYSEMTYVEENSKLL